MAGASFEWDEAKNRANQEKHGVSFEKAQRALFDPRRRIAVDEAHSSDEPRLFCLGLVDGRGADGAVHLSRRARPDHRRGILEKEGV